MGAVQELKEIVGIHLEFTAEYIERASGGRSVDSWRMLSVGLIGSLLGRGIIPQSLQTKLGLPYTKALLAHHDLQFKGEPDAFAHHGVGTPRPCLSACAALPGNASQSPLMFWSTR